MKMCCSGFQNLIDQAGSSGLSVIVVLRGENIKFRIQSRGCKWNDVKQLHFLSEFVRDGKVNIVEQTGLLYCPFCGTKLEKLVTKNRDILEKLAIEHEKYIPQ